VLCLRIDGRIDPTKADHHRLFDLSHFEDFNSVFEGSVFVVDGRSPIPRCLNLCQNTRDNIPRRIEPAVVIIGISILLRHVVTWAGSLADVQSFAYFIEFSLGRVVQ
jgi:hypothetical protein